MVVCTFYPIYVRCIGIRIIVPGWPGQNIRPYVKNNLKQKGLEAWLKWKNVCQGPEFKCQVLQKKKKRKKFSKYQN
jgi:hypothetical protein